MQVISDGIYYQNAYAGVTIGAVILPHGTLLIDSPLIPEEARSWKSIILTQSRGMHRLLVNLDEHYDRTLGNRYLDFPVLAHKRTADAFENRSNVFKGQNYETGSEWEKYPEIIGSRWIEPSLTFEDHLHIHWGNQQIHLDHCKGPSEGTIWVEIPSQNTVFIGDTVIKDQPPFFENADIPAWIETLELLKSRRFKDYTIVSGRSGLVPITMVHEQQKTLKRLLGKLDTLFNRQALPDETRKLIPNLLSKYQYPKSFEAFYTKRLQYGLHQYYLKHYSLSEYDIEE
jgi:glyoxylase-like metal-dependent hydrolase (beta-lactamase superfamily II)